MGDHEYLSASSADRWTTCTIAPSLEAQLPDVETTYSTEGTEAADLLDRAIKAKIPPSTLEPGHPAATFVDVGYDVIKEYLEDDRFTVFTEIKFLLAPRCGGTADIIVLAPHLRAIGIIDYKHGEGITVEPESRQFTVYAGACIKAFSWMFPDGVEKIVRTVVQPRKPHSKGPVRHFQQTREELDRELRETIFPAIEIQKHPESLEYKPSKKACMFCKVRKSEKGCPAVTKEALTVTEAQFKPYNKGITLPTEQQISGWDLEKLAAVWEHRNLFKMFFGTVQDRLTKLALTGTSIPNHKLVEGRSNREFSIENEEELVKHLVEIVKLKKKDLYTVKLKSLAELEKLLPGKKSKIKDAEERRENFSKIVIKPKGKTTLVHVSDPRESVVNLFQPIKEKNPTPHNLGGNSWAN